MLLDEPSVTGTANIVMAAALLPPVIIPIFIMLPVSPFTATALPYAECHGHQRITTVWAATCWRRGFAGRHHTQHFTWYDWSGRFYWSCCHDAKRYHHQNAGIKTPGHYSRQIQTAGHTKWNSWDDIHIPSRNLRDTKIYGWRRAHHLWSSLAGLYLIY